MPRSLPIELDRSSPVPLYHQIATAIDRAIDSGDLVPGEFLENEIALAARLSIARPTARQALQELVDRGRLLRRRGVGTQVAPRRVHRPVELTSLYTDLSKGGRAPSTEVLSREVVPANPEVAAALELKEGDDVVDLRRLRRADGEPLAVMVNYLPPALAPSAEDLASGGLYELLRSRGHVPKVAHQSIGARIATAAEARLLQEEPRSALLTMTRTAYDESGTPIEHGRHIYRASHYVFDTTVFGG